MGKLQNLQLNPYYLLKVKRYKQRILKSVVTVLHYSIEE